MKMTRWLLFAGLLALSGITSVVEPAQAAPVQPPEISWQMVGPDQVRFQLHFMNNNPVEPTMSVSGEMFSQPFGAFLPDYGLIGTFNVPPMMPNSFFDVFFDVPLSDLPPNPQSGNAPYSAVQQEPCPPPQWIGNVDVNWFGPGGAGQVNRHFGEVGVCPTGPKSCVHTITMCQGEITWAFSNLCPGWTVTLVNEDFTPAPALLPPNWTGWICITADGSVPVGATCCFSLNLNCGGVVATIDVCAIACPCPTPAVPGSWSHIKTLYR